MTSGPLLAACCCSLASEQPPDDDGCSLGCGGSNSSVNYDQPLKVRFVSSGYGRMAANYYCSPNFPHDLPECGLACAASLAHTTPDPTCNIPTQCLCGLPANVGNFFFIYQCGNLDYTGTIMPVPNQVCEGIWRWYGFITVPQPRIEWSVQDIFNGTSLCQKNATFCAQGGNENVTYEVDAFVSVSPDGESVLWNCLAGPTGGGGQQQLQAIGSGSVSASQGDCHGMQSYFNSPPNQGNSIVKFVTDSWGGLHTIPHGNQYPAPIIYGAFTGSSGGGQCSMGHGLETMPWDTSFAPPAVLYSTCPTCYVAGNCAKEIGFYAGMMGVGVDP